MFKDRFIQLCNKSGDSPSKVCERVGITRSSYSAWTDESVPRKATLMRIADYFGVTVDYLLGNDEPKNVRTLSETEEALLAWFRGLSDAERAIISKMIDSESLTR